MKFAFRSAKGNAVKVLGRAPNRAFAGEGEAPAEPLSLLGRSKRPASQEPRLSNSLYFVKLKSFTALHEGAFFRGVKDDSDRV